PPASLAIGTVELSVAAATPAAATPEPGSPAGEPATADDGTAPPPGAAPGATPIGGPALVASAASAPQPLGDCSRVALKDVPATGREVYATLIANQVEAARARWAPRPGCVSRGG